MATRPATAPDAGSPLTLVTLGAAALMCPGLERPILGPGKPLALLIYLSFSPAKSASREHLTDLLWNDADPERARHALRQTLWQIRALLGDDVFAGREEITLLHHFDSDRARFLAAVAEGRIEEALRLYRGPFLPGFASPGGAAFEQWADIERSQFRSTFVRASETLVRRLMASGHARDALGIARRLIDLGSGEELGRRLAIEAHLASADMISAATEADALERWAAAQDESLEPATRDAIRRTRHTGSDPAAHGCSPASASQLIGELVGREKEFSDILEAWAAARSGNHRHIHLLAPAGLGKTRLLRDLEARLAAMRGLVRYVRANPGDRAIAGALLGDVARALSELPGAMGISPHTAATLVALEPSLSSRYAGHADPATGDEARRRRMLAISELASSVAAEGPFALLVDDMHWADAESHAVLEGVAARLVNTASLLLTASRPVAERHFRSDQRVTLQLDPLDAEEIRSFLASLGELGTDAASTALDQHLLTATGGSPLLLIEMLQLALERGAIGLAEGHWTVMDPDALAILLRAGEGIRQRIARLGTSSRQLISMLAVAGAPVPAAVLASATGADPVSVESHLAVLERTGFATQLAAGWQPSHDEIGEQALPTNESARQDVDRALGRALLASGTEDHTVRVRAAQHLARVGDAAALAALTIDELRRHVQRHEPRTVTSLLADFIPDNPSLRAETYRRLPLATRLRHGVHARSLIGMSGIAATLAIVLLTMAYLRPVDDQRLVVFSSVDSARQVASQVSLRLADWRINDTLRQSSLRQRLAHQMKELPPVGGDVTIWANGDSAIYNHAFATGDTGGQDLVLLAKGRWSRVASAPHDDVAPTLSPDQRRVAFLTARWSPDTLQDQDLAVVDLRTGKLRHLTTGRDFDLRPSWSPDGTRLAFVRQGYERRDSVQRLCTITVGGGNLHCRTIDGVEPLSVVGWLDWKSLLVVAQGDHQQILIRIAIGGAIDSVTVVDPRPVSIASLSPDRRWLACWCESDPTLGARLEVRPIDQPDGWRPVAMSEGALPVQPSWIDTHPDSSWLDTIRIGPPGHVVAGTTHALYATGRDPRGMPASFDARTVRWSSSDTAIATIDSVSGEAHAIREGTVWLRVTAGGWRDDSVQVRVDRFAPAMMFRETWLDLRQWGLLGAPSPQLVGASPAGRAFLNNGDGIYTSGAWSRAAIDPTHGIALDVDLSTPINRINWQTMYVAFGVISDTTGYVKAVGENSLPRPGRDEIARRCGFSFPSREGAGNERRVAIDAGGRSATAARPFTLSTGALWHLRIQLFDDGTCGIAINQRAVYRSPNSIRLDRPMHLLIEGNSVGTRMLVGPLTVWSGDPGGVDWEMLKQGPPRPRIPTTASSPR